MSSCKTLEVGTLGLVAGLDEGLVARLDERGHAAAENGLLAEEVSLGLFGERRLEHAGARGADGVGVGQRDALGVAGGVLFDRDQGRHAAALEVGATHEVPGSLGSDHGDVNVGWWFNQVKADVEAVREQQALARGQVRGNRLVVGALLLGVGHQHHDHVSLGAGVGDGEHAKSGVFGLDHR